MPKTRQRQTVVGKKSVGVRIKYKIGNRYSTRGAEALSLIQLVEVWKQSRARDKNKIYKIIRKRLEDKIFYLLVSWQKELRK